MNMSVSTTSRFHYLKENPLVQEVYIGESPLFIAIRRHMQALFSAIYQPEGDVGQNESALMLRFEMQKWLTSPLLPDATLFQRCGLGDSELIRRQWGNHVAQTFGLLKDLIARYTLEGSVLNTEFIRVCADIFCEFPKEHIKIWCHRKERDLFRELLDGLIELDDEVFISTLAEYRKIPSFDALIRFGPLRTSGLANVPAALITSPSYNRLIRFVWVGLPDEEGFADDPVLPTHNYLETLHTTRITVTGNPVTVIGLEEETALEDDLGFFDRRAIKGKSLHQCVLVEFPSDYGVLMRPGARLLVFRSECTDNEAIDYCHIGNVEVGDYLLLHNADADLGEVGIDVGQAPLAALWKKALADAWKRQPNVCVQKMRQAGIGLLDLSRAVQSWTAIHGSVIRAPQRKHHFKALLTQVLDPDLIPPIVENGITVPGWYRAWAEIESSRVAAIQHGTLEHAIVNEQLVAELYKELPAIRRNISLDYVYRHRLRPESGLIGSVAFKPVISLSPEFAAPAEQLEKTLKLPIAEQYRIGHGGTNPCA